MEKYTGSEDFGPSHFDDHFDFDFDLRLKPFDYFLIILYVLFIFPFAWIVNQIFPPKPLLRSSKNFIEKYEEDRDKLYRDMPTESYCLWPRHSHS